MLSPGAWLPLPHQLGTRTSASACWGWTVPHTSSLWLAFVCVNLGPLWSTSFEDTTGACKPHSLFLARSYLRLFAESDTTDMCSLHTSLPHLLPLWSVKPYAGFITLQRLVLLCPHSPDLGFCLLVVRYACNCHHCSRDVEIQWCSVRMSRLHEKQHCWEPSQRPYVNGSISVTQPDPSSFSLGT